MPEPPVDYEPEDNKEEENTEMADADHQIAALNEKHFRVATFTRGLPCCYIYPKLIEIASGSVTLLSI